MVTHTLNLCSAFNPSKCTHTAVNTHKHSERNQWATIYAAAPGEVRCLAQGSNLSRGIEGGESTVHSLPHLQSPPNLDSNLEPFDYEYDSLPLGHDFQLWSPRLYLFHQK